MSDRVAASAERQVLGTEIVAPLRDAVRLVDRQQADVAAGEQRDHVRPGQPFGRDVGEAELAALDLVEQKLVLLVVVHRVEAGGRDPVAAQLRHLVAHQRNQRRHHDGEPWPHQCRQLVAQRLA
jgi:hypothetical protein